MRDQVVEFLAALGVTGAGEDVLLDLVVSNVQQRIMNLINLSTVPDELEPMAVQMAAGDYLNLKKGSGQIGGFDLEAAIKQIQEGDTTTTFAIGEGSSTPEQRLNGLIDFLINGRMAEIYLSLIHI